MKTLRGNDEVIFLNRQLAKHIAYTVSAGDDTGYSEDVWEVTDTSGKRTALKNDLLGTARKDGSEFVSDYEANWRYNLRVLRPAPIGSIVTNTLKTNWRGQKPRHIVVRYMKHVSGGWLVTSEGDLYAD